MNKEKEMKEGRKEGKRGKEGKKEEDKGENRLHIYMFKNENGRKDR